MMNEKEMLDTAKRELFEKVVILDTRQLMFRPEFRAGCEENLCGNYNRNYGCPPDCGTPEEMKEKAMRYARAVIFQTRFDIDDPEDGPIMNEIKREHVRMTRSVTDLYERDGIKGRLMVPGPCVVCAECARIRGEACVLPERQTSCLSAYGLDVTQMAEKAGMDFDWEGRVYSYFSVFLFNPVQDR